MLAHHYTDGRGLEVADDNEMKVILSGVLTGEISRGAGWSAKKALAVLLKVIPADTSRCMNYDCVRLAFGRAALAGFDDALLRGEIPQARLLQLCPPGGTCK
ncbi:MAG: hypothetical protein ABSB35_28900 [Bryobacteraceae bacterium]